MSKLNPKRVTTDSRFDAERQLPGGMNAARQSNIALLRRLVLANLLWEKNAYVDGETTTNQIAELIPKCDQADVFNLVVESRLVQKLRHTPIFIINEMVKYETHRSKLKHLISMVCTRADMLSDLIALYWKDGKKPLPNQYKKGIELVLNNLDEYQMAKYRKGAVSLRDLLFLSHAKPKNKTQELLFKKLANNELETPVTWETQVSQHGNTSKVWETLIGENRLGGLATLRNLSNMMKANVSKNMIEFALEKIPGSMLLPLDWLKAARSAPEFEKQIESAMLKQYENLPKLKGRTLFIVDVSGSMGNLTSGMSQFSRLDQAAAMAMLASFKCQKFELVCTAGADHNWTATSMHVKYPIKGFGLINQINATRKTVGQGGIFTRQCLEWCQKNVPGEFDRIIVFSDSQDMDRQNKVPKPYAKHNYIIDVSAHKNGVNYKNVWTAEISGWSEHFLSFIEEYER